MTPADRACEVFTVLAFLFVVLTVLTARPAGLYAFGTLAVVCTGLAVWAFVVARRHP